ncbi:hypothetical protein CALCODRAFT_490897 [Calocera cornea HHB12733]|uniref:ABM domain-containing protein n=1 Tax=Calocera cornea HHB12733 TaxID=1353952 RepID=A0A165JCQ6_9BASI|nr:hypothetical protein CALCODRAFT_490897 [Calocera cornea HHB12733]
MAKPGKMDELLALLKTMKALADSDAEPGVVRWEILKVGDELTILEQYADVPAILAHIETAPFKEFQAKKDDLLVEGSLSFAFWEEVA